MDYVEISDSLDKKRTSKILQQLAPSWSAIHTRIESARHSSILQHFAKPLSELNTKSVSNLHDSTAKHNNTTNVFSPMLLEHGLDSPYHPNYKKIPAHLRTEELKGIFAPYAKKKAD